MKKFYCVITKIFNNGKATMFLKEIESLTMPQDTCDETYTCDIYKDYFLTREEAQNFINENKD